MSGTRRVDVVIVGGGHNGLAAAAYLARAGRSVLVLEALDHLGGAAVSARTFAGVDARMSRYSYLVSLLPRQIVAELGLPISLVRRRYASYTPVPGAPDGRGLLIDHADAERTEASFRSVCGPAGTGEWAAWQRFYERTAALARGVFPTMTEPLPTRAELRKRVADDAAWAAIVEQPIGEVIESTFADDTVRGVVLTDALIGTFADAHAADLRQNRCFLYHVVGNGTGDWDVPVGGMGTVSGALERSARDAGARLLTGCVVTSVTPDGCVTYQVDGEATEVVGTWVLCGAAPARLAELLGEEADPVQPEGSQLKVNMVLRRLPRLREAVEEGAAFSGTFHVNEGYAQLQQAWRQASQGELPALPPSEIYCHSLSDPTILGSDLRAAGAHTLTLFGLHQPARLFAADPEGMRQGALEATLRSLDSVLAEPIADCLWDDANGEPCIEARTPVDLEEDLGLPGGHIFHRDLSWPFVEDDAELASPAQRWGVSTGHERLLLCGAGAVRGGGVSAIAGRAAAMAVLEAER